MRDTTFIYCLTEPGTKVIRYFGKANSPRDRHTDHIREARTGKRTHVGCWIRKLLKVGQRPDLHVLCEVPREAFERFERAFIALGRHHGFDLTNLAEGGENPPALRGPANPNFGKKYSPERRAKMRAALLGRKASPETREKLRLVNLGRKQSEETRAKRRGKRHSKETIEKMRLCRQGFSHSEESKNKLRVPKSEETRLKFRVKKSTNTSGFVGVCWNTRLDKWSAAFCDRRKSFYVGIFSKIEDAVFARALAIAIL